MPTLQRKVFGVLENANLGSALNLSNRLKSSTFTSELKVRRCSRMKGQQHASSRSPGFAMGRLTVVDNFAFGVFRGEKERAAAAAAATTTTTTTTTTNTTTTNYNDNNDDDDDNDMIMVIL